MRIYYVCPQILLNASYMANIQTPNAVRGTQDINEDAQSSFSHVVGTFQRVSQYYGFNPVQVPVIEQTAVFARSLGESTDVVSKEMYSFKDRGGDSITLRPEFTAGISRAYLANGWQQHAPYKLSTHGPLFRYERPQKGRYRQFHQIDAEIIGAAEPLADIELLIMADQLLRELKISDGVTLNLNTLGDTASRDAWRDALVEYFESHKGALSQESLDRLSRNPLRILDSKNHGDQKLCTDAPVIDDYLTSEAEDFFASVTSGLDSAGVAWTRNASLVRGLDYYRHTAFEFITDRLGAQGTVLGGGRYDGLIENLGGPATPAVGWAAGIERLAMLIEMPETAGPETVIIPLGDKAQIAVVGLIADIRRNHITADMAYKGNMKKRMQKANGKNAKSVIIMGDDELERGEVSLKILASGEQHSVAIDGIVAALKKI